MTVFPIRLTPRGFVVHPKPYRGMEIESDPLATSDVNALVLRWDEPFEIEATDPWPQVRVRWSGGHVELSPRTYLGLLSPLGFEAGAERMLRKIATGHPSKVKLGWIAVPVVEWERVSGLPALPEDQAAARGQGAYRRGGAGAEEVATAARAKASPLESMLDWLASSPEREWRDHPREVRLTEDTLYAARRDGSAWRLPLSALRARVGPEDDDAVYVFGRRTRLVLTHREPPCPVRAELDRRLGSVGHGA